MASRFFAHDVDRRTADFRNCYYIYKYLEMSRNDVIAGMFLSSLDGKRTLNWLPNEAT